MGEVHRRRRGSYSQCDALSRSEAVGLTGLTGCPNRPVWLNPNLGTKLNVSLTTVLWPVWHWAISCLTSVACELFFSTISCSFQFHIKTSHRSYKPPSRVVRRWLRSSCRGPWRRAEAYEFGAFVKEMTPTLS